MKQTSESKLVSHRTHRKSETVRLYSQGRKRDSERPPPQLGAHPRGVASTSDRAGAWLQAICVSHQVPFSGLPKSWIRSPFKGLHPAAPCCCCQGVSHPSDQGAVQSMSLRIMAASAAVASMTCSPSFPSVPSGSNVIISTCAGWVSHCDVDQPSRDPGSKPLHAQIQRCLLARTLAQLAPPSGKLMQGSAHGVMHLDSGRVNSSSPVSAGVLFSIGLSHPLQVSQHPAVVFVSVVQPSPTSVLPRSSPPLKLLFPPLSWEGE